MRDALDLINQLDDPDTTNFLSYHLNNAVADFESELVIEEAILSSILKGGLMDNTIHKIEDGKRGRNKVIKCPNCKSKKVNVISMAGVLDCSLCKCIFRIVNGITQVEKPGEF